MMKVAKLLNKKYHKKLIDYKDYKKELVAMQQELKKYNILATCESDDQCFYIEMVYQSLKIKQRFEDVFFDTYVAMFDYWYDLTYLQRKYQMNVEIDKLKAELASFTYDGKIVYMPCFSVWLNQLYANEIVLLDLKQYHTFIRTCEKEVKNHLYGYECYDHNFCSAMVLAHRSTSEYVLYHPVVKRFYLYRHDVFQYAISIDPKLAEMPMAILTAFANALLDDDEAEIIDMLLDCDMIKDRMKKKIKKYQYKKIKKEVKENIK